LIEQIDSVAINTTEKGDTLENLASYLFLLIPGHVPRRNLLDLDNSFETDIVVRNLGMNSNVYSDLLGRHFLIECKNWEEKVGVKDVGYFLYRIRLTHSSFGVIFAKSGITGKEDSRAAYSLIRKSFHEDGSLCIVVDKSYLSRLAEGQTTFWSLLLELIEINRFGNSKKKSEKSL
jgi:hypothetical protein